MWWWILHVTGVDNVSGPWYGFWSGFGSDLGEIEISPPTIAIYRRHNCHVKGCWRIGKYSVEGTGYVVCRHHHPDEAPTHHEVLAAHHAAKARRAQAAASQAAQPATPKV